MGEPARGIRSRWLTGLFFVALWASTWLVTVVTWERDAAGYSVGMSVTAIPLHLLLPFVVGVMIGLSWSSTPRAIRHACVLAGLAFGLIHFALLWLVDLLWLPEVEAGLSSSELAAEAVAFAVAYAAISVVLSIVGGRIGSALRR